MDTCTDRLTNRWMNVITFLVVQVLSHHDFGDMSIYRYPVIIISKIVFKYTFANF